MHTRVRLLNNAFIDPGAEQMLKAHFNIFANPQAVFDTIRNPILGLDTGTGGVGADPWPAVLERGHASGEKHQDLPSARTSSSSSSSPICSITLYSLIRPLIRTDSKTRPLV